MLPRKRNKYLGQLGEDFAVRLLQSRGYTILERNFRCKAGELDIVAIDGDTLVFVEVKTRWSTKYGEPQEAVDFRKLHKIGLASDYYLAIHKGLPQRMRVDVVALEITDGRVVSSKIIHAE